ncbi:hypothetical protein [Saccharicrinis aurantiacus]|uniref:hypothetical protein n=1 Tax=Saccharicrinis aurantiacus TaxID=1849719 RepID=UPI000838B8D2|nr:hypothetical protein [Saccharicrinis aurantiacus]
MKIPQIDFTLANLTQLKEENSWNDHFTITLWPRLLNWLGIIEQFKDYANIEWRLHYTPNNMHSNMLSAHIIDPNKTFNFYFQIPLKQNFQFNLYLGDNTYNFFEIHPFLVHKGVISNSEPKIEATSSILPHLVLSTENSKYQRATLMKINSDNYISITKNDPLINLLVLNFSKFIAPLNKIISGEWQL